MPEEQGVKTHIQTNAKAYSAGIATFAIQPFATDLADIIMWGLSFVMVAPPEKVGNSIRNVLIGLTVALIVRWIPNKEG
jgi:hypothetical protein